MDTETRTHVLAMSAAIGGSALALGGLAVVRYRRGQRALAFDDTDGGLLASDTERIPDGDLPDRIVPRVRYRYTVGGREHVGERWFFGDTDLGGEEAAARWRAAFPVGTRIKVYYDPRDPARSVIVRDVPDVVDTTILLVGVVVVCFLVASCVVLTGIESPR